jgi:hypothetical protein
MVAARRRDKIKGVTADDEKYRNAHLLPGQIFIQYRRPRLFFAATLIYSAKQ